MSGARDGSAQPWYRSRRNWIKLGISATVTVVLLYFLVVGTRAEIRQLVEPEIRPGYLLVAVVAYLFVALCRAVRFQLIHRELKDARLGQWLQVAVIHAGLNQILPFRSGETTYPYLLHRIHRVTVGRSVLVLLSARVLDLLCNFLYAIFFVFLLAEGALRFERSLFLLVAVGVVAVCGVALAAMRPMLRLVHRWTKSRAGQGSESRSARGRALLHKRAERLLAEADVFKSPRHFAATFLLSAALWLGLFLTFWGLMNGFGFHVPLPVAVIGTVGAAMMNVLPINGVANFGTMELGWTAGLMTAGLAKGTALAAGLWTHLGNMSLAVLVGIVGFVWMKLSERRAGRG